MVANPSAPPSVTPVDVGRLLAGLPSPRALAAVTTLGAAAGGHRLLPVTRWLPVADDPATIVFAANQRDPAAARAHDDIRDSGEFVLNVISHTMVEAVLAAGGVAPAPTRVPGAGPLATVASAQVLPVGLRRSPLRLECLGVGEHRFGRDRHVSMIVGEVVHVAVADDARRADGDYDAVQAQAAAMVGADAFARMDGRWRPTGHAGRLDADRL